MRYSVTLHPSIGIDISPSAYKEVGMGLIVESEPKKQTIITADQLHVGDWFIDEYHEIYLVAQDDLSPEKRIICIANSHPPFLINKECYSELRVARVLENYTTLRIVKPKAQEVA